VPAQRRGSAHAGRLRDGVDAAAGVLEGSRVKTSQAMASSKDSIPSVAARAGVLMSESVRGMAFQTLFRVGRR
jgi:hypothetical protein